MFRYFIVLSLSLICLFGTGPGYANSNCTLTAGWSPDPPFHFLNDKNEVIGSDADILRMAASRMGCSLEFKNRPWSRILHDVETGQLDVAIGAKYTNDRASFAYYSPVYKGIKHYIYVPRALVKDWTGLSQFLKEGNALGAILGWGYPPGISRLIEDPKYISQIRRVSKTEQLIQLVQSNRVKGVVLNPNTLEALSLQSFDPETLVPVFRFEEELHFLLSKKAVTSDRSAEFANVVYSLKNDGTIYEILEKYNVR